MVIIDTMNMHQQSLNWTSLQVSVGGMANWQVDFNRSSSSAIIVFGVGSVEVRQLAGGQSSSVDLQGAMLQLAPAAQFRVQASGQQYFEVGAFQHTLRSKLARSMSFGLGCPRGWVPLR